MEVSAVTPICAAIERTRKILFQPFDLRKWLTIGFCAWLASLARGGGGSGGGGGGDGSAGEGKGGKSDSEWVAEMLESAWQWVTENFVTVSLVVALVLPALFLLGAVVLWLRARGRFMFIDCIAHDRGAVAEPWRGFRGVARHVFVFDLLVNVACLLTIGVAVGLGLLLAWEDIAASRFAGGAICGLAVCLSLLLPTVLVGAFVDWILDNFIVPALYLHGGSLHDAWGLVRHDIFAQRSGTILLYLLMHISIEAMLAFISLLAVFMSLGLTLIPYLGTVILLPLAVFMRCYSLCFLEQFGERWRFYCFEV